MTPELFWLALTALLTGCLWIPVVIGYVQTRGFLTPEDYVVAPTDPLPEWVKRAQRCQANATESFAPFAALVLIAHVAGVSSGLTALAAATFFWARLAHAAVHISGFKHFMARTLIFNIGWLALLAIAWEILTA